MSRRIFVLGLLGSSLTVLPARAQVVQLPTFQFFTVNTSVSVPDRGGAYLGGVGRSSMGTQQFAPPWMRPPLASGIASSASGVGITATVHDLHGPATGNAAATTPEQHARGRLAAASRDQLPRGAAERQAAAARNDEEARCFLELGDRARAAGKLDVAKVYYTMSARRAQGRLARTAADRLTALASAVPSARTK